MILKNAQMLCLIYLSSQAEFAILALNILLLSSSFSLLPIFLNFLWHPCPNLKWKMNECKLGTIYNAHLFHGSIFIILSLKNILALS